MEYYLQSDFGTETIYMTKPIPENLKGLKIVSAENEFGLSKLGVANSENRIIIPVKYGHIGFSFDLLVCTSNGGPTDVFKIKDQNVLRKENYQDFYFPRKGLMSCKKNGYYGCINAEFEEVIPFVLNKPILWGSRDHEIQSINGRLALINIAGKINYFEGYYTYPHIMVDNRIGCQDDKNQWGVLSYDWKVIVPFEYDALLLGVHHNMLGVKKGMKFGFLNIKTGEEVIPCIYDEIKPFDVKQPIASVKLEGKTFFVNNKGVKVNPMDLI